MKKPAIFITLSTNAHHPILASDCEFSPPSDIKFSVRFVIQSVPLIFSLGGDSCRRNCVSAYTKPASTGNLESVFPVQFYLLYFMEDSRSEELELINKPGKFLQIFFYTRQGCCLVTFVVFLQIFVQLLQIMYIFHINSFFQCIPQIISTTDSNLKIQEVTVREPFAEYLCEKHVFSDLTCNNYTPESIEPIVLNFSLIQHIVLLRDTVIVGYLNKDLRFLLL